VSFRHRRCAGHRYRCDSFRRRHTNRHSCSPVKIYRVTAEVSYKMIQDLSRTEGFRKGTDGEGVEPAEC